MVCRRTFGSLSDRRAVFWLGAGGFRPILTQRVVFGRLQVQGLQAKRR